MRENRGARSAAEAPLVVALVAIVVSSLFVVAVPASARRASMESAAASVTVHLAGVDEDVAIEPAVDGSLRFVLDTVDGKTTLTPAEFARRVYDEQSGRSWWKRLLNISSLAGVLWVAIGFLGQALFTGRMLMQWLASEREKRSVVPVAFWWLSLIGASMLLCYFVWRKDVVGVVGQATGWVIYLRNLRLVYRQPRAA